MFWATDQCGYKTLRALRRGEIIDFQDLKLRMVEGELTPGDLYIAERNTGPKLLTVRKVDKENGWVCCTCTAYWFDLDECVKVEEVQAS